MTAEDIVSAGLTAGGLCVGRRPHRYGERFVFQGGKHGEHSLCVSVTSAYRLLMHWRGYCSSNDVDPGGSHPRLDRVSRTAPDGSVDR